MSRTRRWRVDIFIEEHEDERTTRAEARLYANKTQLVGRGTAHRHPDDTEIAAIGDELAAARALSGLSHELVHAAAAGIEAITKERVHLRG